MPRNGQVTRSNILRAASNLFYKNGIGNVSIDAIVERVGITKRSFYYHFRSKDDLIAAYLESKDLPSLDLYRKWFNAQTTSLADRIESIFVEAGKVASHPKWKGCGYLRTVSELANKPGHQAIKIGASHKKRCEEWLAEELRMEKQESADLLAKQIMLLLDGAFSSALVHRDSEYFKVAGKAAATLVASQSGLSS